MRHQLRIQAARIATITAILVVWIAPIAVAEAAVSTLRGRTLDPAGRPVASARLLVLGTDHKSISDEEGRFEFTIEPGSYSVKARASGYETKTVGPVTLSPEQVTEIELILTFDHNALEEIVVTSKFSLLREQPAASVALDREQIAMLPHFGDDLFRATAVLPGISGGDISAKFSVRGSLYEEVLVRLDGIELFEPFHLKDFEGIFSILDPDVIDGVDLIPSSYPAEFGDRLGGVLDMRSVEPTELRTTLGISFSNLWVGSAGTFADDRGRWLGSLRRGFLDLVLELAGGTDDDEELDIDYWDGFAKVDYDINARNTVSLKVLTSDDTLRLEEVDDLEVTDVETGYGNTSLWASHQWTLSPEMYVDTVLSVSRLERDRDAFYVDPPSEGLEIVDLRELDLLGIRQDWTAQLGERHYLKAGFEFRGYDVSYDYSNNILRADPIDDPRFPPGFRTSFFEDSYSGEQYSVYVADRMRLGAHFTAELGARYDQFTLTDESDVSPRVNLVYDLGRGGTVRAAWGRYLQSHRPHELDVQFGETEFQPVEQSDHWTAGWEGELGGNYILRADAYHREVENPRVRYEALFDPFRPFPEVSIDLIQIAADRVVSDGVELYLSRRQGPRFGWWLSYTYSEVEEEIEGVTQPRFNDQTHAVTASASYRTKRKWNLTAVWSYHTGWPTTTVSGELELVPGERDRLVYDIGPFYAERLDDYHRLDFRASRTSKRKRGELTFFIDVQNLYDNENPRGVGIDDPDYFQTADGRWLASFPQEDWLGIMPSFGVTWVF